uniref:Uncharacterized protein n=1 Tax=Timema tahoe TaxID=61484 RepID=A0A7R9ICS2_9NEOP|nr:unnamed protein product [Timema tahoe]
MTWKFLKMTNLQIVTIFNENTNKISHSTKYNIDVQISATEGIDNLETSLLRLKFYKISRKDDEFKSPRPLEELTFEIFYH